MKKIAFAFFIISFFIYFFSSAGATPYDYFTRLSDAFLHGKYWLTENPSWLTELIPSGPNKFYVPYPPTPAVLLIPFVFIFGRNFPQQLLAHTLGSGIVALTVLSAWKVTRDKKIATWSGLLIGFASIVWFLSSVGSSWYLGQITAAFFLTAALTESFAKNRPFLVGVFLGAAYLSRLHTILTIPLFIYLSCLNIPTHKYKRRLTLLAFGILPFILFNALYNLVRFGVIWDQGYFLLPKVLHEENAPWFIHGVANPVYILDNLRIMFWSFPKILSRPPYIQPSWAGLAIWITTPAFIYALRASLKDHVVRFSWLSALLVFLVVGSHGGTGFAQFGYRFAVDFYPILTFLTIKAVARTGLAWHHWLLLSLGIIVNLWGVIWINKFGWVSF